MKWAGFPVLLLLFLQASAQDQTALTYTAPELLSYNLNGSVSGMRQYASVAEQAAVNALVTIGISGLDTTRELIIKFDSSGKMLYKNETPLITDVKRDEKSTEYFYRYDHGQLITKASRQNGHLIDSVFFDYDRRNRISSYIVYDNKSRVRHKYTFTYNSLQQLITIRRKNEENFPVEMIKLKYDKEGSLTEQQFFDDNMKKIKVIAFNDHLSDSTGYYNSTILTYSETGQLASGEMKVKTADGFLLENSAIDSTKKVTHYHTLSYNEQKDIEEERLFANMENITATYKYKYDEHGNWTEKVITINDKPVIIASRTYEYF